MLFSLLSLLVLPALLLAQAPNNVAELYPDAMTATCNCSHILVKVARGAALGLLPHGYSLLEPTGLPDGYLSADEFPLYLLAGYLFDIRQGPLKLPHLSQANVYVPFVDVLHDGKTPFLYNTLTYLDELVPAVVGDLTGFSVNNVATFDPPNAAYKYTGADDFSLAVSQELLTGLPLVGVGFGSARLQYALQPSSTPVVRAETFQAIANLPRLNGNTAAGPKCGRSFFWFNETYSDPFSASGQVQLFPPALPAAASFDAVDAYVGTAAWISPSSPGSDCTAYRN